MSGKGSGHKKPGGTRKRAAKKRTRLVVVIVVAVLLIGSGVAGAFAFTGGTAPAAGPTPAMTPSVTDDTTEATPAPDPTVSLPEDPNVDEITPLPVETPPETPMAQTQIDAYCRDFQTILLSAPQDSQEGPDSDVIPWAQLSQQYADLITRYQGASVNAPASLVPAYANVLSYLQTLKQIADAQDESALQAQVRMLATLNNAMDLIDSRSRSLCHIK